MRAAPAIGLPHLALEPRRVARPPLLFLRARLRAEALDRDLAAGAAPWRSPLHAARAVQLTSPRMRAHVAGALESLAERAVLTPFEHAGCAALPPCRAQVADALPAIREIAARLRAPEPLDARGVAATLAILRDGAGPCYHPIHHRALTRALRAASSWLDPEERRNAA